MSAEIVPIGFRPDRLISTVSFVCSNCWLHVSPDDDVCGHCGETFSGTRPYDWETKGDARMSGGRHDRS